MEVSRMRLRKLIGIENNKDAQSLKIHQRLKGKISEKGKYKGGGEAKTTRKM